MRVGWGRAFWIPICFPWLLAAQTTPGTPPTQPEPARVELIQTTVTVVEKISAETPANVTVVNGSVLDQTPGTNLDDRLRDVPGFTLFRRASSVVANPTTQGVSLRGIGSSGASRTLVLWDGVPANDPFGGWVYWTQLTPDEIDRVEVARGASTSVFGDRAMSGAITVFSRQPEARHLLFGYETGNENTHDVSAGFWNHWSGWALSGTVRAFTTDGYYIVPEPIRGKADHRAGVRFATGDVHVDRFSSFGKLFFKVDVLAEERQNGTNLTHNSTGLGTASLHFVREFANDSISLLVYHTEEGFHATFSSVPASRLTEKLTFTQTVPSEAVGGAAMWQRHTSRWNWIAGADADRIHAEDTDHLLPTGLRVGGGTQIQKGAFAQGDVEFGGLRFFAGARESFTTHNDAFFSPTAGLAYGRGRLRWRGSVYRAFRAPTLNELYRSFSAGNTFTEANPNLRAETVFGAEAGVDWTGENSSVRVTAYRNSLGNLITNVTLSSSPTSIVRQRANAADALSRGVEAELRRQYRHWNGELKYLYVDSRYDTGPRIAQIPRHQGSADLRYQQRGTTFSAGVRSFDYQFDDDLNQFRLPGYAMVELLARQRLVQSLSAELVVDNALNRVYYTAFTPTPNIGQPRLWRIGLRWDGRL